MPIFDDHFWPDFDPERIYRNPDGSPKIGSVYVLHFERHVPTHADRHYVGWTSHLPRRLLQHLVGEGSEMAKGAAFHGIRFVHSDVPGAAQAYEEVLQGSADDVDAVCGICSRVDRRQVAAAERLINFRLDRLREILDRVPEPSDPRDAEKLRRVRGLYGRSGGRVVDWFADLAP